MIEAGRAETPSRRARQRAETRRRLRVAALERFDRDGFFETSVASIATDAGVTERTFFRHFASKEAVLFDDYTSRLQWFQVALAERPLDEPVLDSVRAATKSFPNDRAVLDRIAELRRSVLSVDAIEAHMRLVQGAFARAIEANVRDRLAAGRMVKRRADAELTAVVVANAIAGALVGVLDIWTRRDASSGPAMAKLLDRAFDVLRDLPLVRD